MSVPLRIIENPGPLYKGKAAPGDMWRDPDGDWEDGECWRVILPNGTCWSTNQHASNGAGRWDVTGVPPQITVSPSIFDHSGPDWHGWIRNGELVEA